MSNKEAITKEEAIKYLEWVRPIKPYSLNRIKVQQAIDLAIKALEERPQGEWKLYGMIYYCSECGHACGESGDNFCGNCGADMREG